MVKRMRSRFAFRTRPRDVAIVTAAAVLLLTIGCDSAPQPTAAHAASSEPSNPPAETHANSPSPTPDTPGPNAFTTTGPLVAEQQADIAAEREGRIVKIAVQIGDRVRRGQVLALLDDRSLRAKYDSQKARIASAQAQVRDWEAEELADKADLRRADLMRTDKIISDENWEHVKYKLDETIAEVAHFRDEETAAEGDLRSAELQLEQSRIVAPFNGVVGRSSVRTPQEVKEGDVLFWITAESPLQVLFTVPETLMSSFTVGKPLTLTTADFPNLRQAGRIARVSPVVDPASGSIQVVGAVVHPSPMLKPGMSIQVRLTP